MNLTFYSAKDYENKSPLRTMAKQTQTNPILSRHSLGEGGFNWQFEGLLRIDKAIWAGL
jgi:hypothetical protein